MGHFFDNIKDWTHPVRIILWSNRLEKQQQQQQQQQKNNNKKNKKPTSGVYSYQLMCRLTLSRGSECRLETFSGCRTKPPEAPET
jgi:hypothetical protein